MLPQYHLKLVTGDVAPYVLLPGDPKRVEVVAGYWDEAHKVADNREYVTYTGVYKGVPISCTSTGIGCPSTSIAMEELARVGATTFIRIGTCGGHQDHINIGDIGIFDSAARYDGASRLYAPIEFPAVATHEVVSACIEAAKNLAIPYHVGTTRSGDAFYAGSHSFNDFYQSDWENRSDDMRRLNIMFGEMESSVIFVLARVWRLRAGGMSVVLDNINQVESQGEKYDPMKHIDHGKQHIERLALMGSETIRIMHETDEKKKKS